MASRRAKRTKRRPSVSPTLTWLFAFVTVVILGVGYSGITDLVRVQVVGAREYDKSRIARIVHRIEGIPAMRIPGSQIEQLVEANFAVKEANFAANVFGRGGLAVRYREPLALVDGGELALDAEGELFPFRETVRPRFTVPKKVQDFAPIFSLYDSSSYRPMARLLQKLQLLPEKLAGKVALDPRGGLCFYTGGLTVEFGDTRSLEQKVQTLLDALKRSPELPTTNARINLVDPDNPTID